MKNIPINIKYVCKFENDSLLENWKFSKNLVTIQTEVKVQHISVAKEKFKRHLNR